MFHLMEKGYEMMERNKKKTYFFANLFSHIEHPNNCSFSGCWCSGDDELSCFSRFDAVNCFFGRVLFSFKWMRWKCSFRLALRVNFKWHWPQWKIRSFVCNRKWHRSEFFPNVRLQIGHGILLSLPIFHLCNISWKMHSASVGVLNSHCLHPQRILCSTSDDGPASSFNWPWLSANSNSVACSMIR